MESLIGKSVIFLIMVGFLSSGVTRCTIDVQAGASFLQNVITTMSGTTNDARGNCSNGVCFDTPSQNERNFRRFQQPTARPIGD